MATSVGPLDRALQGGAGPASSFVPTPPTRVARQAISLPNPAQRLPNHSLAQSIGSRRLFAAGNGDDLPGNDGRPVSPRTRLLSVQISEPTSKDMNSASDARPTLQGKTKKSATNDNSFKSKGKRNSSNRAPALTARPSSSHLTGAIANERALARVSSERKLRDEAAQEYEATIADLRLKLGNAELQAKSYKQLLAATQQKLQEATEGASAGNSTPRGGSSGFMSPGGRRGGVTGTAEISTIALEGEVQKLKHRNKTLTHEKELLESRLAAAGELQAELARVQDEQAKVAEAQVSLELERKYIEKNAQDVAEAKLSVRLEEANKRTEHVKAKLERAKREPDWELTQQVARLESDLAEVTQELQDTKQKHSGSDFLMISVQKQLDKSQQSENLLRERLRLALESIHAWEAKMDAVAAVVDSTKEFRIHRKQHLDTPNGLQPSADTQSGTGND